MGYAIETVVGSFSAAAATGAQPYTPGNNQSFNVRALAPNSNASIESLWTKSTDAGYTRIRSPRLHDDVVGIQAQHYVDNTSPLIEDCFSQTVYSQDSLTVEDFFTVAPTATDIQQVGFQVYYADLPGVSASIKSWAEVEPMIQSYYGAYILPESNATVGEWGVGVAVNSEQDNFKANSYYAIIGYEVVSQFCAVAFQGTDIGNLYLGGPGSTDPKITRAWFPRMEDVSGQPSIPIINSQNKGATLVSVFAGVASTVFPVGVIYAYLGPTGA